MKKMIGKGTGTGRVTYLGPAKPDDPVFKEGWTVSIVPQSRQQSPKPLSTTLDDVVDAEDEGDESECELRHEDSGEGIRCPYCDSGVDCPHRLALIDRTFGGCSSGHCASRYNEFCELVEAAFLDRLKSGTASNYSWGNPDLDEMWKCAFDRYKLHELVDIDGSILTRIVIDLLDRAGGGEYPGSIEDDGGPGCSSALTLFFAKNPAEVMDAALSELKTRLRSGRKAADHQPSGR